MDKSGRYILVYNIFEDRFDEQPSTAFLEDEGIALHVMCQLIGKAIVIDSETGKIIGHKTTHRDLVTGAAVDDE